jgi:diguanylate cyclase (GGDEF)-like protein
LTFASTSGNIRILKPNQEFVSMSDSMSDPVPMAEHANRILIADDSELSLRALDYLLRQCGYTVQVTHDGNEALDALLQPDAPHIAILDWMMPGMDGVEVCRRLRKRKEGRYVYLILVTVRDEAEDLVTGFDAGADDYITKPFSEQELSARLRAGQRIVDLQSALLQAQEQLREQATHDALTGLWNRGAIMQMLNREISRSARRKTPLSIVMGDIDHFKLVNDTHGHLAGDAVLREVARRANDVARGYDSVGRYGGEEFLFVLPHCDSAGVSLVAERMRQRIAEAPAAIGDGATIPITMSLGVATSREGTALDSSAFIGAADAALYRAKQAGRDRVEVAGDETAGAASTA